MTFSPDRDPLAYDIHLSSAEKIAESEAAHALIDDSIQKLRIGSFVADDLILVFHERARGRRAHLAALAVVHLAVRLTEDGADRTDAIEALQQLGAAAKAQRWDVFERLAARLRRGPPVHPKTESITIAANAIGVLGCSFDGHLDAGTLAAIALDSDEPGALQNVAVTLLKIDSLHWIMTGYRPYWREDAVPATDEIPASLFTAEKLPDILGWATKTPRVREGTRAEIHLHNRSGSPITVCGTFLIAHEDKLPEEPGLDAILSRCGVSSWYHLPPEIKNSPLMEMLHRREGDLKRVVEYARCLETRLARLEAERTLVTTSKP